MSHPADCPEFEYDNHPRRSTALAQRTKEVLVDLRSRRLDSLRVAADSRLVHGSLFQDLTPAGHEYFAGHYRGEDFRCLKYYSVNIPSDPRVGYPPERVRDATSDLARLIVGGVSGLDEAQKLPTARLSVRDRVVHTVAFACRVFEHLLRIHPFANGNGHAARFVVWSILGRYGLWPRRWPIEPRPPDPPYTALITEYRNGNPEPLERFVLQAILG